MASTQTKTETLAILDCQTKRNIQNPDFLTHHKGFQDYKIRAEVSETHGFLRTIHFHLELTLTRNLLKHFLVDHCDVHSKSAYM